MTDDIEREALALLDEELIARDRTPFGSTKAAAAICPASWPVIIAAVTKLHAERAEHERFRQEVSDAMTILRDVISYPDSRIDTFPTARGEVKFSRFIIDKPDPNYESVRAALPGSMPDHHAKAITKNLERELAARGLQITEIDNG